MGNLSYSGLHLLANMYDVKIDVPAMNDLLSCKNLCINAVNEVGLSIVGDFFHGFAGGGVTGVVVLAESHVAIHTWPESAYVTLDVFVCNYNRDNSLMAKQLFEKIIRIFDPKKVERTEVIRGLLD